MNRLIVVIFFVTLMTKVSFSQDNDYSHRTIDSAHIIYSSPCRLLNVRISITDQKVLFYRMNLRGGGIITHQYQTSDKDTLATLRECIETLSYTNPVYDTNEYFIAECQPGMSINFYSGTDMHKKNYRHDRKALFPFAYVELYHIIISIITTHLISKESLTQHD